MRISLPLLAALLVTLAFSACRSGSGVSATVSARSSASAEVSHSGDPAADRATRTDLWIRGMPVLAAGDTPYEVTVHSATRVVVTSRNGSFSGSPTLDLPAGTHTLRYVLPRRFAEDEVTIRAEGEGGQQLEQRFTVGRTVATTQRDRRANARRSFASGLFPVISDRRIRDRGRCH